MPGPRAALDPNRRSSAIGTLPGRDSTNRRRDRPYAAPSGRSDVFRRVGRVAAVSGRIPYPSGSIFRAACGTPHPPFAPPWQCRRQIGASPPRLEPRSSRIGARNALTAGSAVVPETYFDPPEPAALAIAIQTSSGGGTCAMPSGVRQATDRAARRPYDPVVDAIRIGRAPAGRGRPPFGSTNYQRRSVIDQD